MSRQYLMPGLTMTRATANNPELVNALQRDLRALGYLRQGIDGEFGAGTEQAIRALQFDLLHNTGQSRGQDGAASVAIAAYNVPAKPGDPPPVSAVTGILDQGVADCLDRLLLDSNVVTVPNSPAAAAANQAAISMIAATQSTIAPAPFVLAITYQESANRQFQVPTRSNGDNFLTVGLDFGDAANPARVTSRGYGIGQLTLFHHPPRKEEMAGLVDDSAASVHAIFTLLRMKFDRDVNGPDSRAADRDADHPLLRNRRLCKYQPGDPLYLSDCLNCTKAARKVDITPGTPVYHGASISYQIDRVYKIATYMGTPDRADFPCDWPYAVRRYNGGGLDSYHYQCRILRNLLVSPVSPQPGS